MFGEYFSAKFFIERVASELYIGKDSKGGNIDNLPKKKYFDEEQTAAEPK